MTTVTRTSPVNPEYQHNTWHSIASLPCFGTATVPSFHLGLRSYRGGNPPDPC